MIWDLALTSVLIAAGYWGVFFVRQRPNGTATFGIMQLTAAALAGLGLLGHRIDVGWLGIAGAIGFGAGLCMLVIGPLARGLARRLVAAERVAIANRLLDLAELLAPGSGVTEEKAVVRAMAEIREGRIDQTVDALTVARERAPAEARLAIDERIAMLYLAAYRWTDAISHAETHLLGEQARSSPPPDAEGSLRRELGIAPPVWVDLLGAYGRIGDLDRAATMLARLEDVCSGRDDAALWIHRARMMFLALSGRIESVRALVAPQQSRHMTPAARTYWMAVAHEHHGDRVAAAEAYQKARARSRGRPRELIDQAIARLGDTRRAEPGTLAREVVARVEAAPMPPPIRIAKPRGPRATWVVTAILLAVSLTTSVAIGPTWDTGVLVRAGALVHGMIATGEWWRMISNVFVHVGALHVAVNAIGLVLLGRLAEDLFGAARVIAIFLLAGIAGALASYAATPGGLSAGASGAVFGLLGAVLVEITWHRQRYRAAWKRGMWGALAAIAVVQLAYGFLYPVIDQWAHSVGMATGGVLGFALSRNARWAKASLLVARILAVAAGGASVVAWVLVIRTPLVDSLTRGGFVRLVNRDVAIAIRAPADWETATAKIVTRTNKVERLEAEVFQPDGLVLMMIAPMPRTAPVPDLAAWWLPMVSRRLKDDLGELTPATEPVLSLPAGWEGQELWAAPEDEMSYRQRVRLVLCRRAIDDKTVVFVAIRVPETIASAAPEFFAQLLASIGPV